MADPEVKPIKVNADPYRSDLDRNHRICRYYSSDFGHRHLGPGFFFLHFINKMCIYNVYEPA